MKSVDTFTPPHEAAPAAPAAPHGEGADKKRVEAGKFDALLAKAKTHEGAGKQKPAVDPHAASHSGTAASKQTAAAPQGTTVTSPRAQLGRRDDGAIALPEQPRSIHDSITRTTRALGSKTSQGVAERAAAPVATEATSASTPGAKSAEKLRNAELDDVDAPLRLDDEPDPAALQAVLGQVASVVARIVVPKNEGAQSIDKVAQLNATTGAAPANDLTLTNEQEGVLPGDAVGMMAAARAARSRSTVPPGHSVPPLNAAEAASMPGLATRGGADLKSAKVVDASGLQGKQSGPGELAASEGETAGAPPAADLSVSTRGVRDAARTVASAQDGQASTNAAPPQHGAVRGAVEAVQKAAATKASGTAVATPGAIGAAGAAGTTNAASTGSTASPGQTVSAQPGQGQVASNVTAPAQTGVAQDAAQPGVNSKVSTAQPAAANNQATTAPPTGQAGQVAVESVAGNTTVEVPFQVKLQGTQPTDKNAVADSKVASAKERDPMERVDGFTRGALAGPAFSAYGARTQSGTDKQASSEQSRSEELELEDEEALVSQGEARAELDKLALAPEQTPNVQAQPVPQEVPRFDAPLPAPAVPVPQAPLRMPEVEFIARPPGSQTEAATISIHHPDLGPIQLEVHRDHGRVEVHAVLESAHAQAVLRANESGIRQGVQQSGMTFSALRVRVRGEEQPTARPAQARSRRRENSPER